MDRLLDWTIGFALLMMVLAASAVSHGVPPEAFSELAGFVELTSGSSFSASELNGDSSSPLKAPSLQWGFGAVVYGFMVLSGWQTQGLLILKLLLCFGIAIACHGLAVRNGVRLTTFAALSLLALALAASLGMAKVQPALFSAAALVGLLILFWQDRNRGGYWAWGSVPLMASWANLHVGVILGLAILAAYCLTRTAHQIREARLNQVRQERDLYLWLVLLASIAAVFLSADGSRLITCFLAQAVCDPNWGFERLPIWQTQSHLVQIIFLASIAIAGFGIASNKPWPTFESIVLMVTCVFAMNHLDYAPMYIVAWICLTPPLIDKQAFARDLNLLANDYRFQRAGICIAMGLVGLGSALQNRYWDLRVIGEPDAITKNETVYPISAADFLADRGFSGSLLAPEELRGYLTWRLSPAVRLSVCAPTALPCDLPNSDMFGARRDLSNFNELTADAILVPLQAPVLAALEQEITKGRISWKPIYRDAEFAIFIRSDTRVAQALDGLKVTD